MSDNSTVVDGAMDTLNATLNSTASSSRGSTWETLQDLDFLLLEAKLIFSALGIIYVGSHAALRRPPSAAPAQSRKPGKRGGHDDDEEEEEEPFAHQGLELSDAIMFPLMAGIILVGLYYLIQWLNDPSIISKILRWYMSTMSILSMLTLYSHGIDLVTSFVFPRYWRGRDGSLRKVDQKERVVRPCDDVGNSVEAEPASRSPLPSFLSLLAPSERTRKAAWDLRGVFTQEWLFRLYVHGMGEEKTKIRFSHMIALVASLGTAVVYSSTTSPFLSNVLGYGLCYGSFLMLSPTDLLIATLVLSGLFVYDIVMVFYTLVTFFFFFLLKPITNQSPDRTW
jgi:minor histocompatibility antigen H13